MILGFKKRFASGNPTYFIGRITSNRKIHSIREDKQNRWKQGTIIHFATGVRTKKYKCFKTGTCTGTQTIEMHFDDTEDIMKVKIEGKALFNNEIMKLAFNDGFESMEDFENWFKPHFKGKIIHWTDFRY